MTSLKPVVFLLTIIGGVNWGLVGLGNLMGSNWNLVNLLLGSWPIAENIVYILVGISAVWLLVIKKRHHYSR